MGNRKLWFVLVILLAGLVIASPQKTSGVEGVVTIDGRPFAGVEVEASSASLRAFWETSTDRSGHYSLHELRPGPYTVWAEASGYGCIVIPHVVVKEGVRARQDFHFRKGKTYPGCESLNPKKHS